MYTIKRQVDDPTPTWSAHSNDAHILDLKFMDSEPPKETSHV
jgi:hypothetical protein